MLTKNIVTMIIIIVIVMVKNNSNSNSKVVIDVFSLQSLEAVPSEMCSEHNHDPAPTVSQTSRLGELQFKLGESS